MFRIGDFSRLSRVSVKALRLWIKAHGYAITGPNRELYWRGSVAQDGDTGVTEIQYPIIQARSNLPI